MFYVDDASTIYDDFEQLPALVIPYNLPDGTPAAFERDGGQAEFCRVRYLAEPRVRPGFKKVKAQRYGQPKNSGVHAYFPIVAAFDWQDVLGDVRMPLLVTEGEKKALAISANGAPCVGIGGVFNWLQGGEFLAPLASIKWKSRQVFVVFDSDAATNPNVITAESRLAQELSLKLGAQVHIVRLPPLDDGSKCGADDYILAKGYDAFVDLLEATPQTRKIDAEVMRLNEDVCWIERDALIFEPNTGLFIHKNNFTQGSHYSSRTLLQPSKKGDGVVELSVAKEWLTHPHARRYSDVIFDPSTMEECIITPAGKALNTWRGIESKPGNVQPFLDLTAYVFSKLPPQHRDFALKLLAYKFQNPAEKVPIATVIVGAKQGSGKSLWARCIMLAAGQYGKMIDSPALQSGFNGWCENSLVVVLDEATPEDVTKGAQSLKKLISDKRVYLNEKYRAARQIDSHAMFILTSNDPSVGAYAQSDRRMFVVGAPAPNTDLHEFYMPIVDWLDTPDAPLAIADYLINLPLKGWRPPPFPPETAEKVIARQESMTEVEALAEDMLHADENVIAMWISTAIQHYQAAAVGQDAVAGTAATKNAEILARMPIRPFYTSVELTRLFPYINLTTRGWAGKPISPGEMSKQLRAAGVTYLECKDNPRGFWVSGRLEQFLIVANAPEWAEPITQEEFDQMWRAWPSYAQYASASKLRK